MTIHTQKHRAEQADRAEQKAVVPIAERLMRWNIDEITSELFIARVVHYVRAPHDGIPYCRSHDPMTEECKEAVACVVSMKINDSLSKE